MAGEIKHFFVYTSSLVAFTASLKETREKTASGLIRNNVVGTRLRYSDVVHSATSVDNLKCLNDEDSAEPSVVQSHNTQFLDKQYNKNETSQIDYFKKPSIENFKITDA